MPYCFLMDVPRFLRGACLAGALATLGNAVDASTVNSGLVDDALAILSDKCFACHGPDAKDKDLRLDTDAGATEDRGGYRALDRDDPAMSEILARIRDADDPMPPEDADKQLTELEKQTLEAWIMAGGEFQSHWSFVKPERPVPPESEPPSDLAPIDQFVGSRLIAAGADFAPQADRATLARRVALTLTGLPPEPDLLQRFLNDESDGAYERLVDALIATPAFGERQAMYWLDAVRYGDTHGLHLDNRRGIYPYRDWVIRAINENQPVDEFIEWQFAGDLLEEPTMDQLIATGYVRMNPTTSEGGVLPEEFQVKNNFDRTENLGTVYLGMTLTCARCHTHKYDPILQKEYYQLLAYFNSTAESPLDRNAYAYGPVIPTPKDPESRARWLDLIEDRDTLLAGASDRGQARWEQARAYAESAQVEATAWRYQGGAGDEAPSSEEDAWTPLEGAPGRTEVDGPEKGSVTWISFDLKSPISRRLRMEVPERGAVSVSLNGQEVSRISEDRRAGWASFHLPLSSEANAVLIRIEGDANKGKLEVQFNDPWPEALKADAWATLAPELQLQMLGDAMGPLSGVADSQEANGLYDAIRSEESTFTTTLVARELAQRRPTHVLRRGEYNLPTGDPLEPGTPEVLGGLPVGAPNNRLGLAQWLTSRENPLVSRVLVNQIWSRVFGVGLVRTPEDFGRQGERPTHPELLDWLAVEFQESGWDLKGLLRQMVLSRTFRQDASWRSELSDPENRLFSRGPSYRLDAELLRDIGLWASDLLDPTMGGEGVKPYQPDGMWAAMAHPASNTKKYVADTGSRLYRRSLYVYWKRTSPHPMMTLFDAPSRESSCVARSRSSTPLQTLGLLNETQRLEMGRMLAQRLLLEGGDDEGRLNLLYTLLASRPANAAERAALLALKDQMISRYRDDQASAAELLAIGEARRLETLDVAEHAAWTQVAMTALASDAAILMY